MIQIIIKSKNCTISVFENHFFKIENSHIHRIERIATVGSIVINESTVINAEVLFAAAEYGIWIEGRNKDGEVAGHWRGHTIDASVQDKFKQMRFLREESNKDVFASWLLLKLKNQIQMLKRLGVDWNVEIQDQIWIKPDFKSVIKMEPLWMKNYYSQINTVLPRTFQFQKRSRRPAYDPFNAMLNYSYAILYSYAEDAIIQAGLDPYLGMYHDNDRGGKALVYDFVEQFRPWFDEVVIRFILDKNCDDENAFYYEGGACMISKNCKKELIDSIHTFMKEIVRYAKRQCSRKNHIYAEARTFKTQILKYKS